jgi:hypothetical protein
LEQSQHRTLHQCPQPLEEGQKPKNAKLMYNLKKECPFNPSSHFPYIGRYEWRGKDGSNPNDFTAHDYPFTIKSDCTIRIRVYRILFKLFLPVTQEATYRGKKHEENDEYCLQKTSHLVVNSIEVDYIR